MFKKCIQQFSEKPKPVPNRINSFCIFKIEGKPVDMILPNTLDLKIVEAIVSEFKIEIMTKIRIDERLAAFKLCFITNSITNSSMKAILTPNAKKAKRIFISTEFIFRNSLHAIKPIIPIEMRIKV